MVRRASAAVSGMVFAVLQVGCGNDPATEGSPMTGAGTAGTTAGSAAVSGGAGTPAAGAGTTAGAAGRQGTSGTNAAAGRGGIAGMSASAGTASSTAGAGTNTAGSSGTTAGTGSSTAGTGAPPRPGGPRTAAGYMNLTPPLGAPLDGKGAPLDPPAPDGWVWYPIEGAVCRDGSPTGFYVRTGEVEKLLIFLEGGGACSNLGFCGFNPENVNKSLAGDGQLVLNTALGAIDGRQQPGVYTSPDHVGPPAGAFDHGNAMNPFKGWSQVYIPYCTGDVHLGTKRNASVPGLQNQQFVGHLNMKLFIGRIVPTFRDKVDQVILTGSSAGGFGALGNYSMVQDAFGDIPVDAISDSGAPFDDKFMPLCMQKRWRDSWGLNDAFPPDCEECRQADGGGILKVADFLIKKHPTAHLGLMSSMEDEVIRLFFSVGLNDCGNYDAADPVEITVAQVLDPTVYMAPEPYTMGLQDLRAKYKDTNRFATYYMPGNFHQHIFRPSFYEPGAGGTTLAQWTADFIAGKVTTVGP